MADMMLKELEIVTVLAVSLYRQLIHFLVLYLGMLVSIFCGDDLGMDLSVTMVHFHWQLAFRV